MPTEISIDATVNTSKTIAQVIAQGGAGRDGSTLSRKNIFTADGTGIYNLSDTVAAPGAENVFVGGSYSVDYILVGGNSIHEFVPSPIGTIIVVTYFI